MNVTLPNGVVMTDVPEGTSKSDVALRAIKNGLASPEDFGSLAIPGAEPSQQPQQPKTVWEQAAPYVESAIEGAAAVPVMAGVGRGASWLAQGSKAAPYAKEFARSVMPQTGKALLAEGALGALGGAAAKATSDQVPEGWQRDVAGMVAGTAVAIPFSLGKNAFEVAMSRGMGREAAGMAGDTADSLGRIRAHEMARTAFEANPSLMSDVLRAEQIQQQTGVNLPMLAQANGDTTISGYLQGQIAKAENSRFTAQIAQQYKDAEQQLKMFRKGVAPSMEEVDALVKQRAQQVAATNAKIMSTTRERLASRQKTIDLLTDKIQNEAANFNVEGRTDIGGRLTAMVKAKEATVRQTLSPEYTKLLESSMAAGIKLPAESAKDLASFARDETNKDVFGKFPDLYKQIQTVFKPQAASVSSKMAGKYKFAVDGSQVQFKDIPLDKLDSLKRAVNKAISNSNDKDQIRVLSQLKAEVGKAVEAVDPVFSVPYKQLDAEYAKQLGIPFSENGVAQINRAKFVENSVNSMTKTASGLKQVLGVIGDSPEGLKVVEDAFLWDVFNNRSIINTNTGEINPAQLKRYLAQNKEKFDLIPSVRDVLETKLKTTQDLVNSRTAIEKANAADKEVYVKDLLADAYDAQGGLVGTVRKAMNNQSAMNDLLYRVEKDSTAKEAVKSAFLDNLIGVPAKDRLNLFQDPNISTGIAKLFGGDSVEPIKAFLEASVRLEQNPFAYRVNTATQGKTGFEVKTGSKIEQSVGELRNQVMSKHRVFLNHISRYFQNRSTQSEAEAVKKFLLDRDALKTAATLEEELNSKGMTQKATELGRRLFKNASTTYLQGALVGLMTAELNDEPYKPYQPSESWMLPTQ